MYKRIVTTVITAVVFVAVGSLGMYLYMVSPPIPKVMKPEIATHKESKPEVSEAIPDVTDIEVEEILALVEESDTEEVPVSPYGFGPYPEVPSDYPEEVAWEQDRPGGMGKLAELFDRVLIELWNRGNKVTSISGDSYRMYPNLPDTIYVTWGYDTDEDGNRSRYASRLSSGTGISEETLDSIVDTGVVPQDITVLDYESDYIDPYDFLNLKR